MIRNQRLFLPLGLLALTLSVLLGKIGEGFLSRPAFFEGLLLGLATAFAVAGLVTAGRAAGHD